jgi:hypothetical protein
MWVPINIGLPAIISSGVPSLALDPRAPSTLHAAIEKAGVYTRRPAAEPAGRLPTATSVRS